MEKTRKPDRKIGTFLIQNIYLFSALFVLLVFYVLNPKFLSMTSIQNMTEVLAPLLPMAMGIGFALYTGGIDLSIGAVASATCVITGMNIQQTGQWIIPMMLLFGIAIGVITGALVAYLKLPSFIVTLCTQSVFKAVAIIVSGGGSSNIPLKQRYLVNWATKKVLGVSVLLWISLAILVIVYIIEKKTCVGKRIYTVGANEKAARLAGVNIHVTKMVAHALCSTGAAIGGIMYAYKLKGSNPTVGNTLYMQAISAVALGGTLFSGGKGSCLRTLVGVITVTAISSGMRFVGVDAMWENVVFGIVLIAAVAVNSEKGGRNLIIK
mgnify:FL=1